MSQVSIRIRDVPSSLFKVRGLHQLESLMRGRTHFVWYCKTVSIPACPQT